MEIEIGVGLIRLADPKRGGDLLERIQRVRQNMAADIGLIMPKVRIRDNMRLEQNQYRIKIADVPWPRARPTRRCCWRWTPERRRARSRAWRPGSRRSTRRPRGSNRDTRDQAEMFGYTVVEPVSVLATHLTEVVRKHADEILNRDATKHLIDELKKTSPAVVDELIPGQMKLAEVQQILQMLLREQVPIRQLGPILETLGEYAGRGPRTPSC